MARFFAYYILSYEIFVFYYFSNEIFVFYSLPNKIPLFIVLFIVFIELDPVRESYQVCFFEPFKPFLRWNF